MNENYNKVKANLTLSSDGKQIKVVPITNYNPDHGYILCIVGSNSGTCMPFTIDSDSIKVNQSFNNKSITLKKGETLQLTLPDQSYDGGYTWQLNTLDNSIIENTDSFDVQTFFYPETTPGDSRGLNKRWLFKAFNSGTTSP